MSAASTLGSDDLRPATVLRQAENKRFFEEAAALQIEQQRTDGGVETRKQFVTQPREVIEMRIPRGVDDFVFVPKDRNEPAARFEQATRGKRRLAEQCHPVLLAKGHRFATDVEGVAQLLRRDERVRHVVETVDAFSRERLLELPILSIQLIEQRSTRVEPVQRQLRTELRIFGNAQPAVGSDSPVGISDVDIFVIVEE